MTDKLTLADYVELALKRRDVGSGRRLAEIAAADGYEISHSTLNRIRRGNYRSAPTTQILQAIAHLAREPYEAVFVAASHPSDDSNWGELEEAFDEWNAALERVVNLTVRYARLRGISMSQANEELNDMSRQTTDFRAGRGGWYPPWDPDSKEVRIRDASTRPAARQDGEDWSTGWGPGEEDPGMGGDQEGEHRDQL